MSSEKQVVIVTGGGSGLGEAACGLFASQGARVVVVDFNKERAEFVASTLRENGHEAVAVACNVADKQDVEKAVSHVLDTYGVIHVLVNNAGVTRDARLVNMTEEEWDHVNEVNLKGVFLFTQAVAPHMIAQNYGRIVNTSSISANGNFGQTNYAATKAGVKAMTKTWAKELGRHGITVNAVAPGFIKTPMTDQMKPEVLEKMAKSVPVGRLGDPLDIARAYVFLASEESAYINGTTLEVDGGLTI